MNLDGLRLDAYCKVYKVLQLMGLGFAKRELVMSSVKVELKIDDAMHMEALTRLDADTEVEELQRALREAPHTPMPNTGPTARPAAAPPPAPAPPPVVPTSTGRPRGRPPLNRDPPASSAVPPSHGSMPAPGLKSKRGGDLKPPAAAPIDVPIPPASTGFPKPKFAPPKKKHKGSKGLVAAAAAAAAAAPPPFTPVHTPPVAPVASTTLAADTGLTIPPMPALLTSDAQLGLAYDERSFQNWMKRATEADLVSMLSCLDTREKEIQSEIRRCDQILAMPPTPPPAPPPPPPVVPVAQPAANGGSWSAKPAAKLVKDVVAAPAAPAPPPAVPASAVAATAPARSPLHTNTLENTPDDRLHTLSEAELFNLLHKVHVREESIVDELLQLPLSDADIGMLAARLQANMDSIMNWEKDLQLELSLMDKPVHAAA